MNTIILIVILLLSFAGIGAILYIVNRSKCSLPSTNNCLDKGNDYLQQVPYCSSDDSDLICEDQTKVCGKYKGDMNLCSSISCDYIKKKWNCTPVKKGSGQLNDDCNTMDDCANIPNKIPTFQCAQGKCKIFPCNSDDDCGGGVFSCSFGKCINCRNNNNKDCPSDKPFCGDQGCKECNSTNDCPINKFCFSGTCT